MSDKSASAESDFIENAAERLREQGESFQTLLDTLPIPVFIAHDPDGHRITGNRAAAELLRMPPDANLSKSASPDPPPSHFDVYRNGQRVPAHALPIQRAARGEIVQEEEIDNVFEDGRIVTALVSARPLYDAAGRVRGALATMLDVTDQRKADAALRESDRRKDEFLATLSHELRNPLAPLRTALDILGLSRDDPVRFAEVRSTMERQLGQLVRLVDDLLDISRISRGKIVLRREPVDLRAVLAHALETSRPLVDEKHQALETELPEQELHLHGDPIRLAQVFSNLLNNACTYTPAGGTIRVAVERRGDEAVVLVKDSGAGIPEGELDTIFEMFSQAGPARSRGGLGIGLALARGIVELHDGAIAAHSEGPGRGSEFVVRLPLRLHAPSPAARDLEQPAADAPSRAANRRILVVDDNTDAADMLAMLLGLQGHEVRVAYDGWRAIEQAQTFSPSVILLDIGLPALDGNEVCRKIRRQPWGKNIAIVALTGWGQQEDRRRSEEAGFDAHLVKPVDPKTLLRLIDTPPREPVSRPSG